MLLPRSCVCDKQNAYIGIARVALQPGRVGESVPAT